MQASTSFHKIVPPINVMPTKFVFQVPFKKKKKKTMQYHPDMEQMDPDLTSNIMMVVMLIHPISKINIQVIVQLHNAV